MVLHLRYPNAHTHWFSSLMLYLFLEVNVDRFREVMTKVLLERFLVHRPHPWGALVTFIELLRNVKYEFWSQEFIRVAPEVTLLLETVSLIVPRCLTYAEHTICRWQNQFSNPRDVTAVDCLRYLFDISSLVLVLFILGSVLFFFSIPLVDLFLSQLYCITTPSRNFHLWYVSKGIRSQLELCLRSGPIRIPQLYCLS